MEWKRKSFRSEEALFLLVMGLLSFSALVVCLSYSLLDKLPNGFLLSKRMTEWVPIALEQNQLNIPVFESSLDSPEDICLVKGLHGSLKKNALATFVASPKSISDVPLKISTLEHIFFGWAQLEHINFVLLSNHCDVLRLGRRMGLPVVQFSSGSDATDLTYAWALQVVAAVTDTPLIGYVNSDIVFDESLAATINAALDFGKTSSKQVAIVGRRFNVDVPKELFAPPGKVNEQSWDAVLSHMLKNRDKPYAADAEDFWLFSREFARTFLHKIPPFFIGGVHFDNWFTSQLFSTPSLCLIDASLTLNALHLNHGSHLKASHLRVASQINRSIGKVYNIGPGGLIHDAPFITVKQQHSIRVVKRPTH